MYSIKVAVDSNGNQYAAGMGIGVQNTPSGMQSQVLFLADRFAVMTQAGGPLRCRLLSRTDRPSSGTRHSGRDDQQRQNRQLYSVFNLGRNRERWLAHQQIWLRDV
jgi:ribosomal protein S14